MSVGSEEIWDAIVARAAAILTTAGGWKHHSRTKYAESDEARLLMILAETTSIQEGKSVFVYPTAMNPLLTDDNDEIAFVTRPIQFEMYVYVPFIDNRTDNTNSFQHFFLSVDVLCRSFDQYLSLGFATGVGHTGLQSVGDFYMTQVASYGKFHSAKLSLEVRVTVPVSYC